jgi:6-phosphogluconolactonase
MPEPTIVVLPDPEALARHVAGWLTDLAIAAPGRFAISLSGGSTPKRLFEILAEPEFQGRFPWEKTHLFWGDERFVPPEAPDSNLGMTRRALLNHITIPAANIHPMPTTGTPEDAARAYQLTLQTYYGAESLDMSRPLFDVTLLGLGENGHTASLFPDTASLTETLAWVTPVTQPRLTLTYPAIACSNYVAFLVAGANKAEVLGKVWGGDLEQPATRVTAAGTLIWFIDEKARGVV